MSNTADQEPDEPAPKRAYDARRRRERATRERQENQQRVLAAARSCFLQDGYAGTKMVDIADEAGVALASLYRAAPGKVDLALMLMRELAISENAPGGASRTWEPHVDDTDAEVDVSATDETFSFPWIAEETDPHRQVELIADHIAQIMALVAPMWSVFRDAAAADERAAEAMRRSSERRAAAFEVAVALLPPQVLRAERSECADTLYALSSPELYLEMTQVRAWSHERYQEWLRCSLDALLVKPATPTRPD